ncbi:hypothetical protein GLOIN_2v1474705 [Rhizophagus irregularis DAOM 181602=DAOM 197198]|uniref:Uncharacterized protein n=2 Tax=Rhizophagus irregularis TaxID=588596 RepID=A0A015KCC9_RHIIW|nr:hypothetical protein GLOIN_2v1474705 [Rhizophagus irregularis DAOM 181602=DAOM 197198]EXX57136.1 hypothetical protein RirG_209940 [Rhizophagus irregularis DAOM 197198w]POG76335.1 hypothetical protein GLOIN_2v1474705 [Rhizophagus irregularis DAOM 181602=DAOM 197198]|eukprot:XP_025183201.1 hypothetical protein GLOIN_2v1474705 [Rhizophagus irregularis DAOM 181602=DAOM 197198]
MTWSHEHDWKQIRIRRRVKRHNEELIASVNQTELAKWIEAGELYEEHEEVLLNQNERTYSGSVGARRNHVDNDGNHIAGETFYGSSGKTNKKTGMKRYSRTSTKRATTTRGYDCQYCDKSTEPNGVSNFIRIHSTNVE